MNTPSSYRKKIVAEDPALIAALIIKGKSRRINSLGKKPPEIIIPYKKITIKCFLQFNEVWQMALGPYVRQV